MIARTQAGFFTIESNREVGWREEGPSSPLREALREFFIDHASSVARAIKLNTASEIYRVDTPSSERWVLRTVRPEMQAETDAQSEILSRLPFSSIVKPVRSRSGRFTFLASGRAWHAYRYVEGKPYDGDPHQLSRLVHLACHLLQSLGALSTSTHDRARLKLVVHAVDRWAELKSALTTASGAAWAYLSSKLDSATVAALLQRRAEVSECVELATVAARELRTPTLVHNDLQHANCLIQSTGAGFFLDIEDICLEDVRIALAHCIFKLTRHAVLQCRTSLDHLARKLREEILPSCEATVSFGATAFGFREAALVRIVSDLWRIFDAGFHQGDHRYDYDLEKKIHNLFELNQLTGSA